jgi:hypothetical protein
MDVSTLRLHKAVLRHLKGVLSAYDAWLADQEAEAAAALLRSEREALDKPRRSQ